MKVLFVDDDPASADALAALAIELGHEASVAYDSERAVNQARAMAFDLILLDIQLVSLCHKKRQFLLCFIL